LAKYITLISYDAILRINENKNKQQKQAQLHDAWNPQTRATLAARTVQASRLAASGTPSPDNKTSVSNNNNSNTILFWCDS
jgi:hypothetical protein